MKRRVGGAVTQRSAKPFRRVRLSYVPPSGYERLDIGRFYFLSSSFNSGKVGWKKWLRSSKICTLAVGKSR